MSHPAYQEEDDPDYDYGAHAARVAEDHLLGCQTAFWEEQEGYKHESPAFGPYDDCTTCQVREILQAALPILTRGILRELYADVREQVEKEQGQGKVHYPVTLDPAVRVTAPMKFEPTREIEG